MERELLSRTAQKLFQIILNNQMGIMLSEVWKRFEDMAGKTYSRTTIETFLVRIEKKGYIERQKCGRESMVIPLITKEEYRLEEIASFCENVFDGDIEEMKRYIDSFEN